MKKVRDADRKYAYGYDQKDKGQGHYRPVSCGFTCEELLDCWNYYIERAASNSFASAKMNKNPTSDRKTIAFKALNLFVLASWFVEHHKLKASHSPSCSDIGHHHIMGTIYWFLPSRRHSRHRA